MTAQPSYAPPPPTMPSSRLPDWLRWVGLGCGALLLLGTVGSVLFFTVLKKATAGPEETVHAFLTAAGSGDFAAAHAYFSEELQRAQPYEQFAQVAKANQHLFQVQDTTFNSREVDLNGAALAGTVTLTGGSQMAADFKLVREKGTWKLIAYHIGSS